MAVSVAAWFLTFHVRGQLLVWGFLLALAVSLYVQSIRNRADAVSPTEGDGQSVSTR